MFKVEFYETASGRCPVQEFIDAQSLKMQARIYRLIELLEMKGNTLREPYSKALVDGIFELRGEQGGNITRLLYFFMVGNRVILTNGFVKKTRRTPRDELELARRYRADFLSREGATGDKGF